MGQVSGDRPGAKMRDLTVKGGVKYRTRICMSSADRIQPYLREAGQ